MWLERTVIPSLSLKRDGRKIKHISVFGWKLSDRLNCWVFRFVYMCGHSSYGGYEYGFEQVYQDGCGVWQGTRR